MSTFTGAAMRLEDYAKLSRSNVTKGLTEALYKTDNILKDIPFRPSSAFKMTGLRLSKNGLPTPSYGRLNETPERHRTTVEQHQETAILLRGNVYMDRRYATMKDLLTSPVKVQTTGLLAAWTRKLNTDYILADPGAGSDIEGPIGLRTRILNPTKYGHAADCDIDGSSINATGTMTKSDAINLFSKFNAALLKMGNPDGRGAVIYVNEELSLALDRAGQLGDNGSLLRTDRDNYKHSFLTYKEARIRRVGRTLDDATQVIPNTENAAGTLLTGGDRTSAYIATYGESDIDAWSDGELDLVKTGTDDTGTQHIWLLDHLFGLYHSHDRTIARIYGIEIS